MSRLFKAAFFGLLIGAAGLVASFSHFAHDIEEDVGLGLLFQLRGVRKAPSDVVVISIDRQSSEQLGVSDNPDRWPRSLHARLVENLDREGAKVIIFDVYFIEPRSSNEDNSFAAAIGKARNVVLAEPLKASEVGGSDLEGAYMGQHRIVKVVKPIAPLSQAAVATAPFVLPRLPVKVNQYWTFHAAAGDSPTFPVVAFQLYALEAYDEFIRILEKVSPNQAGRLSHDADTAIKSKGAMRLIRDIREIFESDPLTDEKMVAELERSDHATGDGNQIRLLKSLAKVYGGADRQYLNYYGPPRTFTTMPFHQALRLGEESGSEHKIDIKGKAVFVGLSEILLTERKDSFYTAFSRTNGVFISGVEIAATAFANLLEDTSVKPIGTYYYILIIFAWGLFVGVICRTAAPVLAAIGILGLVIFYLAAAQYQFSAYATWYPIVIPLFLQAPLGFFGAVLWDYFETNKERQNLRKALGYYAPDEVVEELAKNIVDLKRGDQTVYGACLFTDAAGYTTLSEKMDVRELNALIGKYHQAIFEPVKQNGGRVIDLAGDSVLAIWKAAGPDAELRKQACHAALGVAQAVRQFNQSFETVKLPTRVGVHVGQIFLGNVGTEKDYRYGAQGNTVNTASRLDGLNKYLGTEILVSREVIDGLDGFLTREAGRFLLKGKAQPILVHELLRRASESDEAQKNACAIFAEALHAFRRQSWDEAKAKFQKHTENYGEYGRSNYYLRLCEQYKKNPPGEGWDGVVELEEK
jgi:adenylate cyclase